MRPRQAKRGASTILTAGTLMDTPCKGFAVMICQRVTAP